MTHLLELDDDHDHSHLPVARLTRRRALSVLGGMGAAVLAGCASSKTSTVTTAATTESSATTAAATATTASSATTAASSTSSASATTAATAAALEWLTPPTETGGPFPADGSNSNGAGGTANVLDKTTVFRADMTTDLDGSNKQAGIPLNLNIRIGKKADQSAYAGAAIYVWHCTATGNYSAYSGNMNGGDFSARSFLRAVGVADADGNVSFTTILPGRYSGRASHIHFAVFTDKSLSSRIITSQFAFDDTEADALYRSSSAYSTSLNNPTYNTRDNIFSDGFANQLLDIEGTSAVDAAIAILV